MSDTIDRQAAIDAHCEICGDRGRCNSDICPDMEVFQLLPSAQPEPIRLRLDHELSKEEYERLKKECAEQPIILFLKESVQPEIIRCKDCKYSEHWYRDKRRCFLWAEDGIDVFDDGFCNYAGRRTDEGLD